MKRARLIGPALFLVFMLSSGLVFSADHVIRGPIEAIIPSSAGGGYDNTARMVAEGWQTILGVPLRFVYLPGAATQIGTQRLLSRPADGRAVMLCGVGQTVSMIKNNKPHFGLDDIAFIGGGLIEPHALFVRADDNRWKDIADFVRDMRTASKPLTVSVPDYGSLGDINSVVFQQLSGGRLKIIPYGGGAPARNALLSGEVDATICGLGGAANLQGSVKGLGYFYKTNPLADVFPMPRANDVLDFEMPDFLEIYAYSTLASTPQNILSYLRDSMKQAMGTKQTRDMAVKQDVAPLAVYMRPEEIDAFAKSLAVIMDQYAEQLSPANRK